MNHAHTSATASSPTIHALLYVSQVLMKQRALKHIADSRGVLLRPQDSNAVGGASGKKILGAGRKRAAGPGASRSAAGGSLGAGRRGGGDVDPLAKKVKVRFASQ